MNITSQGRVQPLTPQVLQVLVALAHRPLHGYGLKQQCELDSNGSVKLGRGSLYSLLARLELGQMIRGYNGPHDLGPGKPAGWYEITAIGRQTLTWELDRLEAVAALGRNHLAPKKEPDIGSFLVAAFAPGEVVEEQSN